MCVVNKNSHLKCGTAAATWRAKLAAEFPKADIKREVRNMLLNCEILQSAGGDTYVIINGISFIQPSLEDALAFIASVAPAHELDLVEEWDLDQGPFDLTVA